MAVAGRLAGALFQHAWSITLEDGIAFEFAYWNESEPGTEAANATASVRFLRARTAEHDDEDSLRAALGHISASYSAAVAQRYQSIFDFAYASRTRMEEDDIDEANHVEVSLPDYAWDTPVDIDLIFNHNARPQVLCAFLGRLCVAAPTLWHAIHSPAYPFPPSPATQQREKERIANHLRECSF